MGVSKGIMSCMICACLCFHKHTFISEKNGITIVTTIVTIIIFTVDINNFQFSACLISMWIKRFNLIVPLDFPNFCGLWVCGSSRIIDELEVSQSGTCNIQPCLQAWHLGRGQATQIIRIIVDRRLLLGVFKHAYIRSQHP